MSIVDGQPVDAADSNPAWLGQEYIQSGAQSTATSAGTLVLAADDASEQNFTGVTTHTVVLPDATTLAVGRYFHLSNNSTGIVTVQYNDLTTATTLRAGQSAWLVCLTIATTNGTWDIQNTTASTTAYGTVELSSSAASSVATASTSGTANGVVANADHVHQGVHSVAVSGSSALYGDVTMTAVSGVVAAQVGQNIQVSGDFSGSSPADVGSSAVVGTSVQLSHSDHVHKGMHSFAVSGSTALYGDVTVQGVSGVVTSQTGQNIQVSGDFYGSTPTEVGSTGTSGTSVLSARGDHQHKGLHSIAVSGNSALYGDAVLVQGTNITLTQVGQNITVAATGGGTPLLAVTSKTGTYSISTSDDVILVDASGGAFTVTLPTAVGNTGKVFYIKRTDNTPANAVTLATTSSQTIDGVQPRKIFTQYEEVQVVSNGTNWTVIEHFTDTPWTSYNLSITGDTTNPTFGTIDKNAAWWKRQGDTVRIRFEFKQSTAGTAGSGVYLFSLPASAVIDSTKATTNPSGLTQWLGGGVAYDGTTQYNMQVLVNDSTHLRLYNVATTNQGAFASSTIPFSSANVRIGFDAEIPVTDWW